MSSVPLTDATPLEVESSDSVPTAREASLFHINIEQFEIKSICKDGGIQKAITIIPYNSNEGEHSYEPHNLMYQPLSNTNVVNHNQLPVRFTDPVGNPIQQFKHPTTVCVDIQPRAK